MNRNRFNRYSKQTNVNHLSSKKWQTQRDRWLGHTKRIRQLNKPKKLAQNQPLHYLQYNNFPVHIDSPRLQKFKDILLSDMRTNADDMSVSDICQIENLTIRVNTLVDKVCKDIRWWYEMSNMALRKNSLSYDDKIFIVLYRPEAKGEMRYLQNICERILDHDISYEYRKLASSFLLHCYAYYGNIDGIKTCISNGAIINLTSHRGDTPLKLAIQQGNSDCANILIKVGASVNMTQETDGFSSLACLYDEDFYGWSPLKLAIRHRFSDTVTLLIQYGAVVDASYMLHACRWGTRAIVEALVKAGLSIRNPVLMQTACQCDKRDIVEYLIEKGCPIDTESMRLVLSHRSRDVFEFTSLSGIEWNIDSREWSWCSEAMYDIADTASILAIFKILYHKFIYLGIDSMYDIIQTFLEEGMFGDIYW
jgi:ankyrin repeat protein